MMEGCKGRKEAAGTKRGRKEKKARETKKTKAREKEMKWRDAAVKIGRIGRHKV